MLYIILTILLRKPTYIDLGDVNLGGGRIYVVLKALEMAGYKVKVLNITDCSVQNSDIP